MKIKITVCLLLVLAMLAGCSSGSRKETTTPEPSFTAQPAPETTAPPAAEPTAEPTTVPTTVPETEPAPALQLGYYLLDSITMDGMTLYGENLITMKCYIQIREDLTGSMSIMGSAMEFTWDEKELTMEGYPQPYFLEEDLLVLEEDGQKMVFRFGGDVLPQEYAPEYPVGFFAVSSVGRNGDVEFYSKIDPVNGYIRIREDRSGVMVFDGVTREFTMDSSYLYTETEQLPYFYSNEVYDEAYGPEPMLTVYLDGDVFISIVFRAAEDPENT